jgi:Family of unknown function (DUF6113)
VTARPGRPHGVARGPARAAGYVLLFVFGAAQGAVGAFQFSRGVGHVPLAAFGFALAIGITCGACGKGTRSAAGAVAPALGWLLTAFILAMPRASGSVVITNTLGGQVYLYGGALSAAIGVGFGLAGSTRRPVTPLPPRGSAPLQRKTGA